MTYHDDYKPATAAQIRKMHKWLETATYEELLQKWRFEQSGSYWFEPHTFTHFQQAMTRERNKLTPEQVAQASKDIGWR